MADEIFDEDRLQKMIAAGIFDDKRLESMKKLQTSKEPTSAPPKPSIPVQKPLDRAVPPLGRPLGRPVDQAFNRMMGRPMDRQLSEPMGRDFGDFRGGPRGRSRGMNRGGFRGRGRGIGWNPNQQSRFNPVPGSSLKWQEMDERHTTNKRPRNAMDFEDRTDSFRDPFRDGIRDGIQTKIERNEMERKLNIDFMSDRNSSGKSYDTDLRPVTDTDSRIRDTDLRNDSTNRRNITPTANNYNMRPHGGAGDRPDRTAPADLRNEAFGQSSGAPRKSGIRMHHDELDDFIRNAQMKLGGMGDSRGADGRGRGAPRGREGGAPARHSGGSPTRSSGPHSSQRNMQSESGAFIARPDDPLGLTQPSYESYSRSHDDEPEIVEVPKEAEQNPSKDIAILRETVEELAKSSLYCQYCDCYLSSLQEVNTHIGTAIHQQNMHKKTMEEQSQRKAQQKETARVSQTVIERVPVGMAAIVEMIEQKKQITLKTLTDMVCH